MNTGSEMYPFPIVKKGYDPEAVDSYMEDLVSKNQFLQNRNEDLEQKLAKSQEMINRYTQAEDTLRQNIADSKRAAAAMLLDARQRSAALLEDTRSECGKIISELDAAVADRLRTIDNIKAQVVQFKNQLFQLYGDHIELIDTISCTAAEFKYEPDYTQVAAAIDAFEAGGAPEEEAPVFEDYPEQGVFAPLNGQNDSVPEDAPEASPQEEQQAPQEAEHPAAADSAKGTEAIEDDDFFAPAESDSKEEEPGDPDYYRFLNDFANGDSK